MKCFYHCDIDGKSAGSIVARYTGNYNPKDYIMYDYSVPIPTELIKPGETVYFVDLSFSNNSIDKLKEILGKNCDLIWCDHHDSSMEILKDHPEFSTIKGIREVGKSGAALTYMYLFDCEFDDIPEYIKYVSDFDCWQFKFENTLHFKYGLEGKNHDALDHIWNKLHSDDGRGKTFLQELIENGRVIEDYVKKEYKSYRESFAYESIIEGYKCLVVNRSCNSLVFGNKIKDYPIVAIWVYDGKKYKYSIYTDKEDIDCSKIAEKHGGGGHKKAAGFVSKDMILNPIK